MENLAGGGKPVYLQRSDYPTDFIPLFESLGIPVLTTHDKEKLSVVLSGLQSQNYQNCPKNTDNLVTFLKQNLDL
ncbi:MAG TPA: hypothetical protein ENL04_00415 [Sulfuricurvum sp.]|nr:hypothetical protein [Sulfuricurvum sp.]